MFRCFFCHLFRHLHLRTLRPFLHDVAKSFDFIISQMLDADEEVFSRTDFE